jgi:hypothetical protein
MEPTNPFRRIDYIAVEEAFGKFEQRVDFVNDHVDIKASYDQKGGWRQSSILLRPLGAPAGSGTMYFIISDYETCALCVI